MKFLFVLIALLWATSTAAQTSSVAILTKMSEADVVILGEIHDNPDHHRYQAKTIARLRPRAVVYEMLTREQAARVTPDLAAETEALRVALDWDASGWPDFSHYAPLFAAHPLAMVYGAHVPRDVARQSMEAGLAAAFGEEASVYGLTEPLPEAERAARQAMQKSAHCDALPDEMLAPMVDIQRLRDAALARAVVEALNDSGPPVVVITGNGHARKDWGLPVYLQRLRPEIGVFTLGQAEEGVQIEGAFDAVVSAPPVRRDDPCAALRKDG